MKIATWNVNSIRARLHHVDAWLDRHKPDLLMMQELKSETFPADHFQAAGYHALAATQKTYNGVATLSRQPMEMILDRLPGDDTDTQARYIEAMIAGVRFINIYLPNGNPVDSDKFAYKLDWMARLYDRLALLRREDRDFVIAGDFNIIPADEDCYNPSAWADDALARPESRAAGRRITHLGLTDAYRVFHAGGGHYTFWDYQAGAWPKNHGIRIDHFLLSPRMADRLQACAIDTEPRGLEKASDHTPIFAVLTNPQAELTVEKQADLG